MLLEFDNCKINEGEIRDYKIYDIDSFGRKFKTEMENLTINNTKYDNMITIKLCIDNSGVQNDGKGKYDIGTISKSFVVLG